jgi:hypothetical protein
MLNVPAGADAGFPATLRETINTKNTTVKTAVKEIAFSFASVTRKLVHDRSIVFSPESSQYVKNSVGI